MEHEEVKATEATEGDVSSLMAGIEKEVIPWIQLADDLHALNLEKELSVPQIAVMGDQSCGKSSVLEALSGIPFPRGSGLVTRCPCRLMMRTAPHGDPWTAEASVRGSEKRFLSSPEELSLAIEAFTQQLAGSSHGFSTDVINVELRAPTAPNLTVVDLPGIIRTTTAGQDASVISQVNSMIEGYLADSRTIILAVIPSNQDIATNDILERAYRVDPEGNRTIGVLTKPDLIDAGGEETVLAVLNNVTKPLKLGYIMVKNRSQRELDEGVSVTEMKRREMEFFANHRFFRSVDTTHLGVSSLTTSLTHVLVDRIKEADRKSVV